MSKHYLIYNDKIGEYLKNPKVGFWNTTDRNLAEDMLQSATEYTRACGFKFLEGQLRILEVDNDFEPGKDPAPKR